MPRTLIGATAVADLTEILAMDDATFEKWLVDEEARGGWELGETFKKGCERVPGVFEARPLSREDLQHAYDVVTAQPVYVPPRRFITEEELRLLRKQRKEAANE